MHDTEKDIPRFVILLLDVLLHLFREGLIASLISLDDLACLFENDDDVTKVKKISKDNTLFGIDLKNTIKNELNENADSEQNSDEKEKSEEENQ